MTLGTINGGGQAFAEGDSLNFFGYGNSGTRFLSVLPTSVRDRVIS
jgi:hypothetical protein